jgi:hypothetical protein
MLKQELLKFQELVEKKLNLKTEFMKAGSVSDYDAVLVEFPEEFTEEKEYLSVIYFPRNYHEFQYTDFLQIHYTLPIKITNTLSSDVINFLFFLNSSFPVGNFSVQDNLIVCRYVLPTSQKNGFDEDLIIELIPFFMNLVIYYSVLIAQLIDGEITLNDIMQRIQKSQN